MGNEKKYVLQELERGWVSTGGEFITRFEKEMGRYLKTKDGVAVQNGTAALHLALLLSGVDRNSEVIVPTLTFIATINPIRYLGGEPIFMDCDESLNMDVSKVLDFLNNNCEKTPLGTINKRTKKLIKAIIIVHVFGNMADMDMLMEIGKEYNIKIIEDATEALGGYYLKGKYKNQFCGTIGDFGAFSFNGNKIITTGGGGMLFCKDDDDRKHGKYLSTQGKDNELYYVHNEVGFNYRMTNLQACLGVAQLEQLEGFILKKTENYLLYSEGLGKLKNIKLLEFNNNSRNNYWFYSIMVKEGYRDRFIKELRENGIESRPIWKLNHTQVPYINNEGFKIDLAYKYLNRVINIPCSTNLTHKDINYIVEKLRILDNM